MSTETVVNPRVQELAKKLLEKQKRRADTIRQEIAEKHPHALPETLVFDNEKSKWKCRIKCTESGDESRWVYTSDLHQVDVSEAVQEERAKAKRGQRQADLKEARKLLSTMRK